MTIAHPSRTEPVNGRHVPTRARRPVDDSRSQPHTRHHDFLLLTQDLAGTHPFRSVVAARRGGWIGHSTTMSTAEPATYHDEICAHPVPLNPTDLDAHLTGQCATSITDVYLDAAAPAFKTAWEDAYRAVNTRFADAAAEQAATGGVALVVGHQLQLVPAMLRQRRPDLLIAFFLDLPFPPGEVYRRMPLRHEILDGVLGADLIGFQTRRSADNFRRLAVDDADIQLGPGGMDVDGRAVGVGVFPQSVDGSTLRASATQLDNHNRVRALRAGLGDPRRILLAVDDMHDAAGIEHRLAAYELLLDGGDIDPRDTVLIQIVRPDPLRSARSHELRARIEHRVGLINGRHGEVGRPALQYQHRSPDPAELVALYTAADVLWATPLQAGTSLPAQEYVATRADNSGVVILSEFCGAVEELVDADVANPYDVNDLRRAVLQALRDGSPDRRRRMAAMRRHVQTHDVHHWAGTLLATLGQSVTVPHAVADRR